MIFDIITLKILSNPTNFIEMRIIFKNIDNQIYMFLPNLNLGELN